MVCRVVDQFNQAVDDYSIDFFGAGQQVAQIAEFFHENVIKTVHAYSADTNYRSLLLKVILKREQSSRVFQITQLN